MQETKTNIVFKDGNKKQAEFIEAVMSGKHRILCYGGAIRGGKSYLLVAIFVVLCQIFPRSRWAIFRKDLKRLRRNTRPIINKFIEGSSVKVNESEQTFTFENGSMIMFIGENYDKDKELEHMKGLEVNGIGGEEVSELTNKWFKKSIERSGSYIIPPTKDDPEPNQPPPITILTCNPTQTWVKEVIYDRWKNGTLPAEYFYLPAYVTDNPYIPASYIESLKSLPIYEYKVFVEGDWDVVLKTENGFWHALEMGEHVTYADYDPHTPVHVSIDANTMPYCSATFWQVYPESKRAVQIGEATATHRDEKDETSTDDNHAKGLGRVIIDYLDGIDYNDTVIVYGDATTKNQNTIDEAKRSFYYIVVEELREKYTYISRIGTKNPPIVETGEFVNALYSGFNGWKLTINEQCKVSISDYFSVLRDMDGKMLKKRTTNEQGVSYEEYGHMSDTKRYFFYEALRSVYYEWRDRYSEPSEAVSIGIDDNLFD